MKKCGQMEVTLTVHGRERTFSEQQLIAILEKHLFNPEQVTTGMLAQRPTEGRWFEIKPQSIDQNLFQNKRPDKNQERTRQLIQEAFAEVDKQPEKYDFTFYTSIPKKDWYGYKTVKEHERYAKDLGDHIADWVEQALEWAQRIYNGESWEAVCNYAEYANCYRLVIWKDGYVGIIGGSRNNYHNFPASCFDIYGYNSNIRMYHTVPLVVRYEE